MSKTSLYPKQTTALPTDFLRLTDMTYPTNAKTYTITVSDFANIIASTPSITGLIQAGTNITLTGSGTALSPYVISSTASGSSITLQTDGATNAVQNLLNLKAGSNITLVSDLSGGVTISSTAQSLPSQTGNNGKYLTTDGAIASWNTLTSSIDAYDYIIYKNGTSTEAYDTKTSTVISTNSNAKIVFQAAVDAAYTAGGGLIGVKAGTYLIASGEVNLKSNVHIKGSGMGSTLIQSNTISGAAFRKINRTTADALVAGSQYIIMQVGTTDFTLVGAASNTPGTIFTATGTTTGSGIAFSTAITSNMSLSDMTIDCLSLQDTTAFLGEYIENVTFRNLEVINVGNLTGNRGFGLQIGVYTTRPVTAGSFVVGQGYQITTLGTTNFTLIGAATNTVGSYFVATGVGTGTGVASITAATDHEFRNFNLAFENCRFDNFYSTNEEILLLNTKGVRISGCNFGENGTGQGPGIGIFQWVDNIEITGNTFQEINGPSIYYSLSCNYINIHANTFLGTQQGIMGAALSDSDKNPHPFNVTKVKGLRVTNNLFKGNSSGVQIGSTDAAIIDGNTFQELLNMPILVNYGTTVDTLALGTRTLATNFKITNNTFIDNNQEGIDYLANAGMLFADADGDFYGDISDNTFYDTNTTALPATSVEVGKRYQIATVGTTDFVAVGALSNNIGVNFTATGVPTGTGTVYNSRQRTCITFQGYYRTPAGAFKVGRTYGILPSGFGPIIQNAGFLTIDGIYTIVSLGTTDFTLIGAASNTVGVTFTATGAGSGTGTVTPDTNYTTIGASSNDVGTVFVATGAGYGVGRAMEGTGGSVSATAMVAGTNYVIMTMGTTDFSTVGATVGAITTAGSFAPTQDYQIVSLGTTDFTLIGAASNTVGLVFKATGVGTGTGTATTIVGQIFTATGPATGTGTVMVHKPLVFNYLNIQNNRLSSNGFFEDYPIRLLNEAQLGQNVSYGNNWNVNPNNYNVHGDTSGVVTVNRKAGKIQQYTLTANTTFNIANAIADGSELITMIKQDTVGSRIASWNSTNITWSSGSPPTLSTSPGAINTLFHIWDDTSQKWIETTSSSAGQSSTDVYNITGSNTTTYTLNSETTEILNLSRVVASLIKSLQTINIIQ